MERLIQFQNMIDSLSQKEYSSFIQELTQNKESFKSLLFDLCVCQLFVKKNKNNKIINSDLIIDDINCMISGIIQKRKEENKNNKKDEHLNDIDRKIKIKIDEIPKEMICEISSFLSLKENIKFSMCNKFIFIASRSPTKINEINIDEMQKYDTYFSKSSKLAKITMDRFKNTTDLSLNCTNWTSIHYLSISPSIWKNLTTLNLYHCNISDLFINSNYLNIQLSHIKTLAINDINFEIEDEIAPNEEGEEFNSMIQILSAFKKIEFLHLNDTVCDENNCFDRIVDIPSIPNLRGLSLKWILPESISNALLLKYCKQLEALHIAENDGIFGYIRHSFPDDVKKYKFENLKELCIMGDIQNEDAEILKTINCNTLKRIQIKTLNPHIYSIPDSVVSLLCSPSLEYIALSESLNVSMNLLSEPLKIKRNAIKIVLRINCSKEKWENGLNLEFMNMLKTLNENNKHFMLILEVYNYPPQQMNFIINKYFIGLELEQKYLLNEMNKCLVISNFECNLVYQQKWLMPCAWCKRD